MSIFTGGFPTQVNTQQAPAVAGDFADINPRVSLNAGEGSYVAGLLGVVVAAFCWQDPINPNALNSYGTGPVTAFVSRQGQKADIVQYLADSSMTILQGVELNAFTAGGFWMKNSGATAAAPGMKAYANYNGGGVTFAATGTPPTGATDTGATLTKNVSASTGGAIPVANTGTVTIAGQVMTVSAVGAGSVLAGGVGQTVAGTNIDPATAILSQISGTAGGAGAYLVSVSQTVASATAATFSGAGLTLTGGNTSGTFAPGMTISGTNVPAGETILAYGTATTGGAGTYLVSIAPTVAVTAATITAANSMLLTVSGASTGVWAINDLLSGSGVAANQFVAASGATNPNLTGLGGAGTYLTTQFQSSALTAQTISVLSGVETKWLVVGNYTAAPGEIVKCSSWPLG